MKRDSFIRQLAQTPLSTLLIVLGVIGLVLYKLAVGFGSKLGPDFSLNPALYIGLLKFASLNYLAISHEYWRLLTPTFLHFSLAHLLFNALAMWILARPVEIEVGGRICALIFLLIAIGANIIQYHASGHGNFGGLSGLVYGCLGWLMVARFVGLGSALAIPQGFFTLALLMLGLEYFHLTDFILGNVASAAHIGGLFLGLITGVIYFFRQLRAKLS